MKEDIGIYASLIGVAIALSSFIISAVRYKREQAAKYDAFRNEMRTDIERLKQRNESNDKDMERLHESNSEIMRKIDGVYQIIINLKK